MSTNQKIMQRSAKIPAGLSILVGVGVWEAIVRITGVEAWDHSVYWWLGYPLMLVVAAVLGFIFPQGYWRWGVLIIGAQLIWSFIFTMGQAILLPFTLIIFFVLGVPCVLASYLGAWLSRKLNER